MAKSRRNVRLLVAAPLMAVGLLVIAFAVAPWHERLVADYWQERIDSLPDDGLQEVFADLARHGDLGIRILASQVGSARDAVSRVAYEALRETISGWREDALSRPLAQLRLIAEVLAGSTGDSGPVARDRAAALARQILLWMPSGSVSDREQLLAHCQTVVRLAGADTGTLAATAAGRPQSHQPLPSAAHRLGDRAHFPIPAAPSDPQVARAAHLAALQNERADLAEPPLPAPLQWPETAAKNRGIAMTADGALTADAAVSPSAAEPTPAPRILTDPPEARPIPRPADRQSTTGDAGTVTRGVTDQVSAAEQVEDDLTRLPVIDVMRMLHDSAADRVSTAAEELRQRGLSGQQIELARDLTDSDPAVRRQLVDRLPHAAGLNPRPWLLWLCHDDDSDVRLAALTFLATSTDPRLLDYVRQIADRDEDPRIEALGTRLRERQLH